MMSNVPICLQLPTYSRHTGRTLDIWQDKFLATDPVFDLKNDDDDDEDIGNYDQIDHEYSGQYDNLAGWNEIDIIT